MDRAMERSKAELDQTTRDARKSIDSIAEPVLGIRYGD